MGRLCVQGRTENAAPIVEATERILQALTLKRLPPETKRRNVIVYDLEWIPGNDPARARAEGFEPLELRLVGVYDGDRYRHYETIEGFLRGELTPENSGAWFYAHAGGLADFKFILHDLLDNQRRYGFQITMAFSGPSAIIVKLKKGRHTWIFLDSLWLIRQKLRKIGEWVGVEKGGAEEGIDMFYAPLPDLITYNERDCVVLYKAIRIFEEILHGFGSSLEMTVASCAIKLLRRRFLTRDIRTLKSANQAASAAYVASRVEVFSHSCARAEYYDINSSFPHAMTFRAPGEFAGSLRGTLPDDELYLAQAEIEVPDMELPPLPYRHGARVYFPVGTWKAWFTGVDLQYLEERGGKILRVGRVMRFDAWYDLASYATEIYRLRRDSENEAEKAVLKILLNSCYGKLGEGIEKRSTIVNPPRSFFYAGEKRRFDPLATDKYTPKEVVPGVWDYLQVKVPAHRHVPAAAHITALARRSLGRFMTQAIDMGGSVYYCDTDGFATDPAIPYGGTFYGPLFETSKELGDLKHEKHLFEGRFAAPKLYAMKDSKGWNVKAKGFNKVASEEGKTRAINFEDYCKLIDGRELALEQFVRIRTGLRKGETVPTERVTHKGLRFQTRTKRRMVGKGSVPWNVSELTDDD